MKILVLCAALSAMAFFFSGCSPDSESGYVHFGSQGALPASCDCE